MNIGPYHLFTAPPCLHLHVQLPDKATEVVMLKVLGKDITREVNNVAHNEGRIGVVP